jgi:hypothetical protein
VDAEQYLMEGQGTPGEEESHLFYPIEESEEFE